MATLHKVTEETKAIFKWMVITILAVILIIFLYGIGKGIKEYYYPTPPPPPTVSFGKLPPIEFPQNSVEQNFSLTVNTLTGVLPTLPDQIKVYPIDLPSPNLLDLSRAQDKISQAGFSTNGEKVSYTLYSFVQNQKPFATITFNIVTNNFTLSSNIFTNKSIATAKTPPDENTAISAAENFMSTLSVLPDDLDSSKTKSTFLKVGNSDLIPATSQSDAVAVRIDFYQKNVNDLPIYYPIPNSSTMSFTEVQGDTQPQIIKADFSHYAIDSNSSTYPIKTAKEAFSELKNGNAYIASYSQANDSIQIKNVLLGYYLSNKDEKYLMPIIVFEGDNNFVGYVSAVNNNWINSSN